jgi:SAM-dependent methyltransferase
VSANVTPVRRSLRRLKHAVYLARLRVDALVSYLPLLSAKERVYDGDFYAHTDAVHRPMYDKLADAIYRHLEPRTAVDVGCGTGWILADLADRGTDVRGIEGSRHAIAASRIADRIQRANLERGIPRIGHFDVCICMEVAEHLPKRVASELVAGLASLGETVVFTAATPGQGGTHHVNEQPRSFWLDLFARHGLSERDLTQKIRDEIRDIPEPRWMSENLMVLQRDRASSRDA